MPWIHDRSDAGIATDVDAFHLPGNGDDLIISGLATSEPDVGSVADKDSLVGMNSQGRHTSSAPGAD